MTTPRWFGCVVALLFALACVCVEVREAGGGRERDGRATVGR